MIKNTLIKHLNPKMQLLLFVMLSLFIWIDIFSFFKGDDWIFIIDYIKGNSLKNYVLYAHRGHVMPLFKSFYSLELIFFGKNAQCFQFISVICWGITSFVFYLIFNQISSNEYSKYFAILVSMLLCMHPNFSDIIYWIFQQGIIIHLLFQALTILYYLKYLKEDTTKHLTLFILFLIIQNYFFGNGVLFPLLFLCHYILVKRKVMNKIPISLFVIQIAFILIQEALSKQEIHLHDLINNYLAIIYSFFNLIKVSLVRFFFIKQLYGNIMVIPGIVLFGCISYLAFKNDKNIFFFSLLYLIISTIAISIARFQISASEPKEIHYYYSVLLFPSVFLLLFTAISNLTLKPLKATATVMVAYLTIYFFVNIEAKKIYSYKNLKNKEALNNAIRYEKKNYYPFEDAIYSGGMNIYQDNILNKGVQNSLQKSNYFEADSSIIKYLGLNNYNNFIEYNNKVIDSYKSLEKQSRFDLDISYEKK